MATKQATTKERKKDLKKENNTQNGKKRRRTCLSCNKVKFSMSTFLVVVAAYYVYITFIKLPELPKINMNEYWGLYPMNPKPDLSIRPYKIKFSDVIVNDLRERLLHRRPFVSPLEEAGFTYGFNSNFLTRVLDYWQNKYDFKQREDFFNKYNHYVTNIQGLDIHYMHVKPNVQDDVKVVPLLLLHGWPGSIREFYEIIPKLTTPNPKYKFVFEVIAPSLPGFGFSQFSTSTLVRISSDPIARPRINKDSSPRMTYNDSAFRFYHCHTCFQAPARPGMDPLAMSVVISNLMTRIGHKRYYVQGGDVGHTLGSILSTVFPDNVLGFHTNMPFVFHPLGSFYTFLGSLYPSWIVEPELQDRLYPLGKHVSWILEESGYLHIQATKPDTIGIALTDSPAGLAAYILEKFSTWTNPANRKAGDGNLQNKFTLTHLLDNVMVYWATNSITTSMRLYAESFTKKTLAYNFDTIPTNVPTWGIKFKHELSFSPDCNLRLKYKNYLHTTAVDDGGHFAAMENPEILAKDIFEAVDTFMAFHRKDDANPQGSSSKISENIRTVYDYSVKDINGRSIKLDKYKGYVLLIVNVASQCGLTDKNYHQLNELYKKYASQGLRILAFPCNQFGGQEPGTLQEIMSFTKQKGVQFDVFEKVDVNGDNAHPLWKFLKETQGGTMGDFIKWNFSKFIVNRDGVPVERLGPNVDPLDIEPYLAKYL